MFHKSRFSIEDWFGPFEGWTTSQRWNGWECPYFEFDTAIRMMGFQEPTAGKCTVSGITGKGLVNLLYVNVTIGLKEA